MKKFLLLLIMSMIVMAGCHRQRIVEELEEGEPVGKLKFMLDNTVIFEEESSTIFYSISAKILTCQYEDSNGKLLLGVGVRPVPDVNQTYAISTDPGPNESAVRIGSETGNFHAPDGTLIRNVIAVSGQVSRPAEDKVIVEGHCYVFPDPDDIYYTEHDLRLEIKIARNVP